MKIIEANGMVHDNLEIVESLIINGKSFVVEDVPIKITDSYIINFFKKHNIQKLYFQIY